MLGVVTQASHPNLWRLRQGGLENYRLKRILGQHSGRQRQENLGEFEVNLVYNENSRTARAMERPWREEGGGV